MYVVGGGDAVIVTLLTFTTAIVEVLLVAMNMLIGPCGMLLHHAKSTSEYFQKEECAKGMASPVETSHKAAISPEAPWNIFFCTMMLNLPFFVSRTMATSTLELDKVVDAYAKDYFRRKMTGWREKRLFAADNVGIKIDWKRVRFLHSEPRYEPEPPKPGTGVPVANCLFHTTYTNRTDGEQTYNFKAERSTRSTCTVELEQSYTEGYDVGITLKTPGEILEANLGFCRELEITKMTGDVSEEELNWGVNSDIKVKGLHKAIAKMIITEEEYSGKFELKTNVRGVVHIVFTNLKDNNSFMRACDVDVYELVSWAKDNGILPKGDLVTLDSTHRDVLFTTRGKCQFKYGLRQDVEVDQIAL